MQTHIQKHVKPTHTESYTNIENIQYLKIHRIIQQMQIHTNNMYKLTESYTKARTRHTQHNVKSYRIIFYCKRHTQIILTHTESLTCKGHTTNHEHNAESYNHLHSTYKSC